jgi:ATP-dependent RNA helicase DOB1
MALQLGSMSLTSEDERAGIELVWQNGIEGLSEADRSLSQITSMLPLLKRGIGVHHSGLLPILKELVEILFSEGLIKILFATETFAMGINMPAKTVVFTNIMKFDGKAYRCMTANEYIQMSGRAGRRGIDSRGTCILMLDASQAVAEEVAAMVGGPPAPLTSQFRLSYHTLLNLLRLARADVDVDDAGKILERSFYFFQRHRQLPRMRQKLIELESKLAVAPVISDDLLPRVSSMSELLTLQAQLYATLRPVLLWPSVCLPLLQPGRVVLVRTPRTSSIATTDATSAERLDDQVTDADVDEALQSSDSDSDSDQSSDEERRRIRAARAAARRSNWAHGVVVGVARRFVGNSADALTIDVLLPCQVQRVGSTVIPAVSTPGNLSFEIVRVGLSMLEQITAVRLYTTAFSDLRMPEARSACYQSMTDALKTFGDNVPIVEPTAELLKHLLSDVPAATSSTAPSQLLFQSPTLAALETLPGVMNRLSIVRHQLSVHSLSSDPRRAELCAVYQHSMKLQQRASRLKSIIRFHTATGVFETEFKARSRVLRRLCHIDDDGLLLAKGRVAVCLIQKESTCIRFFHHYCSFEFAG